MNVPSWVEQLSQAWHRSPDNFWEMSLNVEFPIVDSDKKLLIHYSVNADEWMKHNLPFKPHEYVHPVERYWWLPNLITYIENKCDKLGYDFNFHQDHPTVTIRKTITIPVMHQ